MATTQTLKDLIKGDAPISPDHARDVIYGMFKCLDTACKRRCPAFDLEDGAAFKIDGNRVTFEPTEIPRKAICSAEAYRNFTDIMNDAVLLAIDVAFKCEDGKVPASAMVALKDGPCYVDIKEYCDIHKLSKKVEFVIKLVTGSMLCVRNFCDVRMLHPEDYDYVTVVGDAMHELVYEKTYKVYKCNYKEQQPASKKQKVRA